MNLFILIYLGLLFYLLFYVVHNLFLLAKDIVKLIKSKRRRCVTSDSKLETKIATHSINVFMGSFVLVSLTLLPISLLNFHPSDPEPSSQIDRRSIEKTIPANYSRN
jgi:uncharacterized membrane protein SpoIIM required for sporulation